jgi:hypothetical protein
MDPTIKRTVKVLATRLLNSTVNPITKMIKDRKKIEYPILLPVLAINEARSRRIARDSESFESISTP